MYIKYRDIIYDFVVDKDGYNIVTRSKDKANDTFLKTKYSYYKVILEDDTNIQDIYEVDFYVTYTDESETLKRAGNPSRWLVNEGRPLYKNPEIEKNELGLSLIQQSYSDDWIMDDRCSCSKIVDLFDCTDFTVVYTYTNKDGKKLDEVIVEEVKVEAEEFKMLMLKYKYENL